MKEGRLLKAGPWVKAFLGGMAFFAVSITGFNAMAAPSGSGSASDPYTGSAAAGDEYKAGAYIKNLTTKDGGRISLKREYKPKEYGILLEASGGEFPGGELQKELKLSYGSDMLKAFEEAGNIIPEAENAEFAGWYIKGNHEYGTTDTYGAIHAGGIGNEVIGEGDLFLIASDDEEDRKKADIDGTGNVRIKALWLKKPSEETDGTEADDTAAEDSTAGLGSWDPDNAKNHAIEYLNDYPDKDSYALKFGRTKYRYGQVRLCAETSLAENYAWYIKKAGDDSFSPIDESGPELKLEGLTREYNGAKIKCEVDIGSGGGTGSLTYETDITVYHLPEITGVRIRMNDEEVRL